MTAQEIDQLRGLLAQNVIDFAADPVEERKVFEEMLLSFPSDSSTPAQERRIGGIPGLWRDGGGDGLLLYLHGGGYTLGSAAGYAVIASSLAEAGGTGLFSIDYRLAPEARFPAALDDARAAYEGLLKEGADPARIVVAGDSAGGGLAIALLVALRDAGIALPAGAAVLSPWADLSLSGETVTGKAERDPSLKADGLAAAAKHYLGSTPAEHPLASPLFADLSGLPPLLIEAGEAEILLSDATRLAARAAEAGVDVRLHAWPGMVHDWPLFAFMLSEGRDAIAEIGEFIAARTKQVAR